VSVDQDEHLAAPHFRGQDLGQGELCVTFENLLTKTPFVNLAKKVLSKVESIYERPVDMEFAWDGNKFFILQCRSLSTRRELDKVTIPEGIPAEKILFATQAGLTNSVVENLEYVVYVNPRAYDVLATFEAKMEVAQAVNLLNKHLSGKKYALMGPGRWGSNDINLGVKVTYASINKARLLVEIAFAKEGYRPEVSYGTHFFQDLVEADIVTVPLFPDDPGAILNESFLLNSPNMLTAIAPEAGKCQETVRVIHIPSVRNNQFLHVFLDMSKPEGIGFFGPAR
jgi:hypothetical protein